MWNPAIMLTMSPSSLPSGSFSHSNNDFQNSGWSMVSIAVISYFLAILQTNFRVEHIQLLSLGSISIIGGKVTVDFPGYSHLMIMYFLHEAITTWSTTSIK